MSNPLASSVHIDSALTNLSIAFLQNPNHFIASRVFPNVSSEFRSNKYYTFDRNDFNRDEARKRAEATESAGGGFKIADQSFFCDVYAFHKDIADQQIFNADAVLDLRRAAVNFVTHKLLIQKEADWVDKYFKTGVWTTEFTGSPVAATGNTLQWNDDNSRPIQDIDHASSQILETTGFLPNKLILGFKTFLALKNHPDIVDRVRYVQNIGANQTVTINESALGYLFGVDEVLVGRAIKNSAAEGLAASNQMIAGKHALLVYAAPTPAIEMPSAGYTFTWRRYLGSADGSGLAFTQFYRPERRATCVEGEMAYDHKLVSADLGAFWNGIVA